MTKGERYNKYKKVLTLIFFVLLLLGCYSASTVAPPKIINEELIKNSIVLNASYEEAWSALIDYTASTFFAIDSFEKDSGLITVDFGSDNPGEFINCGNVESQGSLRPVVYSFEQEGDPELKGIMSVIVKEVNPLKQRLQQKQDTFLVIKM